MKVATTVAALSVGLAACAYSPPATQVAPNSQVGGVGSISYSHKPLNQNTDMLTVHVAPGLLETETSMSQRMLVFANEFAAKTCPRFDFVNNPNPDIRTHGLTERDKVYTFRCS